MTNGIPKRWDMNNALFDAYWTDCTETADTHWHSHFLLCLITGGSGVQEINGKKYPIKRGNVILLSPMDFHRNILNNGEHITFFAVKISEKQFYHSAGELCELNSFPLVSELTEDNYKTANQLFEWLIQEQKEHNAIGKERFCSALIDQLMILVLRSLKVSTNASHSEMRKALIYIHCHFKSSIKATDVAHHVGYTPNYFSAEFKKETGIEFRKYLQNMRLDFAKSLLLFSHFTVKEACFESGFNTLSHFSQIFKKRFGITPEQVKEEKL